MPETVRVSRSSPGSVTTDDGYAYRFDGEPVDVLPQHLWLFEGSQDYTFTVVEVPDAPVILPALRAMEAGEDTLVLPEPVVEVTDLSGAKVKPPKLPKPQPVRDTLVRPEPAVEVADLSGVDVEPAELPDPEPLPDTVVRPKRAQETADLTGVPVEPPVLPEPPTAPATAVPAPPQVEPTVVVTVSDLWSPADIDLHERSR